MRKWIWSGMGLMVFSCAAMYLAAQHAAEHPDSVAARFFRSASTVGMRCNPLLAIGQAALPEMPRPVDKPNCQPLCVLPDPIDMAQEQALVPLPGIAEAAEAPEVSEPIVVESDPPPPPAAEEPAAEQPVTANDRYDYPVYPKEAFSEEYEQPVIATSGDDEETLPQPSDEPYGYESSAEEGASMPYVSDDADEFEDTYTDDAADCCDGVCGACRECSKCNSCAGPKMGCCCSCGMLRIIKVMCCGEDCPECARCARTLSEIIADYLSQVCSQDEAVSATTPETATEPVEDVPATDTVDTPPSTSDTPPSDESPMNPDEAQDSGVNPNHHPAREDPHYHHHYPSCPYTGRCPYPYHYNIPRVDPVERRSSETPPTQQPAEIQAEEQQQSSTEPMPPAKPVKKKKIKKFFFLFIGEEACECQPGVDTMECRPTDLHGKVRSPF